MGQKKIKKRHDSIWSVYGYWNIFSNVFLKRFNAAAASVPGSLKSLPAERWGFTLVELLVSVGILSILLASSMIALNPFKQLSKAKDSQRVSDITKIRSAADIYYDDQNCYPTTMPFGQKLQKPNDTILYLNPVPQDPDHSKDNTQSYLYETDGSSCPQWNVLFSRVSNINSKAATTCSLAQMSGCLPPGFNNSGYNYCVVSGNVNCAYISSNTLLGLPTNFVTPTPTPIPTANPNITPSPTATPNLGAGNGAVGTPTPIPTSTPGPTPNCSPRDYICSLGRCNIVAAGTGVYCTRNCDNMCQ